MSKRGLSMIGSAVIIMALTIAIGVIVIIIYNIVSSEIEYSTEANVSLMIMKNSVVVDDEVSLTISRDLGNADLQKIRFVLSDGENTEEVEKDAKDFEELTQKDFSFTPKLVSNVKTIKIVPIVKVNGKLKYLSVQSSVEIKPKAGGGTTVEQAVFICGNAKLETGEECDDGNLIASDSCSANCKTESCATQKGEICSSGKTCPSGKSSKSSDTEVCCKVTCVSPTTDGENGGTTPTCGDGTCNATESCSSCVSDCGVCPVNCGNSVVNSGEQCDNGVNNGVACSASYGINCSYCSSSCINTTVQGARCGDGTCQSANENSVSCVSDCPICTQGQTQQCGTTDVGECAYGTQTCGADKIWGTCVGEIVAVTEVCSDSKDNDCDSLTDCADSNCNGQTCASGKICSGGSCVSVTYTLSVSKSGSGTVTSSPSGINCGSTCSYSYNSGTSVTLAATPSSGYTFSGWSGACSGTGTCSVTMSSAKSVTATFVVSCTDDCTPSGTKVCDGTGYKTCGNYDGDSCLEWSSVTNCGTCKTCSSGNCVNSANGISCGTCKTCSSGSCNNVPNLQDPNNECGGSCCGYCDGGGGCAYVSSGSTCSSCSGHDRCDDSGACTTPKTYYTGPCVVIPVALTIDDYISCDDWGCIPHGYNGCSKIIDWWNNGVCSGSPWDIGSDHNCYKGIGMGSGPSSMKCECWNYVY